VKHHRKKKLGVAVSEAKPKGVESLNQVSFLEDVERSRIPLKTFFQPK
jgi:hypothetical protein